MSSIKSQKGSTILMMLVLLAGVMMATIAMFANSQVNDSSGARFLTRQRALYLSDGTRAFAVQLVQDFLKQNPTADGPAIQQYLKDNLPLLMPTGYTVDNITAELINAQASSVIPNGTFKGMIAPQAQVKFSYTVTYGADAENRVVHSFDAVVDVAQVGLHQFMYFIDLDSAGFSPGPVTSVNGRMHANGDLCIAGGNGLTLSHVTSAGHLWHSNRTGCGQNQTANPSYPLTKTFISSSTDLNNPVVFGVGNTDTTRNDDGCTKCSGTSQAWHDYALSTWNGNVQDVSHLVPKLTLPIPSSVKAQVGASGSDVYTGYSNTKNSRLLVDPVLATDTPDIKKLKYSYLSDVRIIDGVWYLRNKANPDDWPGRAIWSDHPGHFKDTFGKDVGQDDLKSALGWATVPRGFSYYSYNAANKTVYSDGVDKGTLSYGWLYRDPSSPSWKPGQLVGGNGTQGNYRTGGWALCEKTNPSNHPTLGTLAGAPTADVSMPFDSGGLTCTSGVSPTIATALLNGTRAGFDDPHVAWFWTILYNDTHFTENKFQHRSHIEPVNFDVGHFQTALKNSQPGELGSYFTQLGGGKTSFNGIVYVTTSWPGSDNGYNPEGAPTSWPILNEGFYTGTSPNYVDALGDTSQMYTTSKNMLRTLPYQLCSSTGGSGAYPKPGDPYDQSAANSYHFVIPDCTNYGSAWFTYPNAIRIFNGTHLDTSEFPTGLSIVSNMPVYLMGSYNLDSKADQAASATPWVPALIAGDQVTFLSDAWDDLNDPMKLSTSASKATYRTAVDTTYNVSVISGWAMHKNFNTTVTNEALHSMPALMEDWGGQNFRMNGSVVIGYYPVFYRGGRYYFDNNTSYTTCNVTGMTSCSSYNYFTYRAGNRLINYDKHLELIKNQPPGSPTFYTSSTQSWKVK